jgi:hypothetical protein
MKACIPKMALSLFLAVPASYGTVRILQAGCLDHAMEAVLFYGNLPARISDAVTNFKMLPERMNPIRSECN